MLPKFMTNHEYGGTNYWGVFSTEIGNFRFRARQLTSQA